jgi:hypothetical protein
VGDKISAWARAKVPLVASVGDSIWSVEGSNEGEIGSVDRSWTNRQGRDVHVRPGVWWYLHMITRCQLSASNEWC